MPGVIGAVAAAFTAEWVAPHLIFPGGVLLGRIAGGIVGAIVTSALTPKPRQPDLSTLFDQQARGLLINSEANDDPIPVVYGRRRVGGTTILKETTGGSNQVLSKAVVWSEGEVAGVRAVYLDQVVSTDARFAGWAEFEHLAGTDSQAASTLLLAELPAQWSSAHQAKGVAYSVARLTWSETAWTGEPAVTVDLHGRLLYDPRDGQTRFSHNPALVIRDYLTNSRYGRGIPSAAIDDAAFADAANHCEERVATPAHSATFTADASTDAVSFEQSEVFSLGDGVQVSSSASLPGGLAAATTYYWIPTGDASGKLATSYANALAGTAIDLASAGSGTLTMSHVDTPRYTFDGVVDTSQQPLDNLRQMLSACRGMLVFAGGAWKLRIDRAEAASGFAFTEDNIVGAWQIQLSGKRDRFNRATARFFNPARQWQPDFAVQASATFLAEDNALELEAQFDLPFTASPYIAARIAQLEMRQSRLGIVAKFRATIAALAVEVGDVVSVTHSTPGWSAKLFRVTDLELLADDEIGVTLREYDDGVYSLDALSAVRTAPATNLPDPFANLAITLGTPVSGTAELFVAGDGTVVPRIRVPFTPPANPFIAWYEVQFARDGVSPTQWIDAPDVQGASSEAFVHPVEDGVSYSGRIRAVTSLGNAGAWSYFSGHTVSGKTEAPSDVEGAVAVQNGEVVVFGCDPVADADLDRVAVYWGEFGNTTLANAEPIANILRGQDLPSASIIPGTWTFLFVAFDTSGNQSANPTRVDLTVTASGFTAVDSAEAAPDWVGRQMENWLTKSENFNHANWLNTGIASKTINAETDWYGALTLARLEENTSNSLHHVRQQSWAVADDVDVTFSVTLKKGERTWAVITFVTKGNSTRRVWFDLANGAIGTTNAGLTAHMSREINGCFRCVVTTNIGNGGTTPVVRVGLASADGTHTYTGTSGYGLYAGNAQLTVGSVPREYLPTDTAAEPTAHGNFLVSVNGALVPDNTVVAESMTDAQLWDTFCHSPATTCTYTYPEIDKGVDGSVRVYADIVSELGPGETSGAAVPVHWIDYKLAAGSYDGFEEWLQGNANFRYLKSRVVLTTADGVAKITGFETAIDVRTRTEVGSFTTDGSGTVAVSFAEAFHNTPVVTVSPQGSGDVSASYASVTGAGFTAYFKSGGAAAAGTGTYAATGG